MMVYDPQIPWGLWFALAASALFAWGWYALVRDSGLGMLRRTIVLALMAISLSLPLALLLNPTWVEPIVPPQGRPLITVLVDATQSMLTADCDQRTRWSMATDAARQIQDTAGGTHDVSVLAFGQVTAPLTRESSDADGSSTNLATALRNAIRSGRPQGHAVLLLSDGAHNVGSSVSVTAAADSAKSLNTPIYSAVYGGSVGATNLSVSVRNPQLMTFPDRPVEVRLQLIERGLAGRSVTVTLSEEGEQISAKRVRLTGDGPIEVSFDLRPEQAGLYRYLAKVGAVEGEVTEADNLASFQLQVIDEPIRVLLLEGKPYWDSKFLAGNLASDPAIELTTLVRIREGRMMRRTDPAEIGSRVEERTGGGELVESESAADSMWRIVEEAGSDWTDPDRLRRYRVVVLGRSTDEFLDEAAVERLRQWISFDGGALVCSRGQPTSALQQRLSQLLPIRWGEGNEERARGQLTALGRSAALVAEDGFEGDPIMSLPSLAIAARPMTTVGLPQVLVQSARDDEGRRVPIVSHQPFGTGQSVVVEGAGMWRWAFLPPEKAEAQKVYAGLWQGLMQWLISQQALLPGQQLALRSDRLNFVTGDDVTATVLVADPEQVPPDCLLDGTELELPRRRTPTPLSDQPGVFRVNFGVLPPGHYSIRLDSELQNEWAASEFDVRDPWFERLDVDARPGLLRQISSRSGGKFLSNDELSRVIDEFLDYLAISKTQNEIRTSLWDRSWVLLTSLGCWAVCWLVRRRSGLV